jgi:hypothetical protein
MLDGRTAAANGERAADYDDSGVGAHDLLLLRSQAKRWREGVQLKERAGRREWSVSTELN